MDVQQFIRFDEFLTPRLITIVYVIGVIIITLASVFMLATMYSAGTSLYGYTVSAPSWHFENIIYAIVIFVFGNLYWRVLCEIVIVIFKINEHATSIDDYFKMIKGNQ